MPIALIVIRPCNRRGSCWFINFPEILNNPQVLTVPFIRQKLIQNALDLYKDKAQSWLIRFPANEKSHIAIVRELGFQPLKLSNTWHSPQKINPSETEHYLCDSENNLVWQEVNTSNANDLLRLEQAAESSQLRQIQDRQWRDYLNPKSPFNKVLISKSNNSQIAIAGFVVHDILEGELIIKLLRDLAWDQRLSEAIPKILKNIELQPKNITLESSIEDTELTELIKSCSWNLKHETLLLGRTIWRRQESQRLIKGANQLESMLGRFGPQSPPLPTPSLEPR